jgi:hypothetical protein
LITIVFQNFRSIKNSIANVEKLKTDVVITEIHTLPNGEEYKISYYGDESNKSNIYIGRAGYTHSHEKSDLLDLNGLIIGEDGDIFIWFENVEDESFMGLVKEFKIYIDLWIDDLKSRHGSSTKKGNNGL